MKQALRAVRVFAETRRSAKFSAHNDGLREGLFFLEES